MAPSVYFLDVCDLLQDCCSETKLFLRVVEGLTLCCYEDYWVVFGFSKRSEIIAWWWERMTDQVKEWSNSHCFTRNQKYKTERTGKEKTQIPHCDAYRHWNDDIGVCYKPWWQTLTGKTVLISLHYWSHQSKPVIGYRQNWTVRSAQTC